VNIVIIGAGQLGSRHLQAMALLEESMNIYVVDPLDASLEQSRKRFIEVDRYGNKRLFLLRKIDELPAAIEFAVIATTSIHRLNVIKELLHHSTVKYLLLEKFLFPFFEEYEEAQNIIAASRTITYVNCARRQWENYKQLKREISNSSKISLIAKGTNWNLASNSIHLLDLFFYLNGHEEIQLNTDHLQQQLIQNKREGFIEFLGTISGTTERGSVFQLTCEESDAFNFNIEIETDEGKYCINETNEQIDFNGIQSKFPLYYQSQLTHIIYKQLIHNGSCDLTPFEESVHYHLILLRAFNEFLGDREGIIT